VKGRGTDLSAQVAAFEPLVLGQAGRFSRLPDMQNDFDDFAQEGRIAVWECLARGVHPSRTVVENRMRNWAKHQRRKGLTGFDELTDEVPALL
jgi:hypothetical protein